LFPYGSSIVRPPKLTSYPHQSSSATYVAPHNTRDPLVA
jgi:hypothetical protein